MATNNQLLQQIAGADRDGLTNNQLLQVIADNGGGGGGGGGQSAYTAIVDADGDGDYTDIATAVASEGANSIIFIKPGTYNITSEILVAADDVTLVGSGRSTIISAAASLTRAFYSTGSNFTIENLQIRGNFPNFDLSWGVFAEGDKPVIKGLTITGVLATAIVTTNPEALITGNSIVLPANPHGGVGIQAIGDGAIISDNYVENHGADVSIYVQDASHCIMDGNRIDCTSSALHGIEIGSIGKASIGNVISNNTIRNAAANGIYLWADNMVQGTTITGNTIFNSQKYGIGLHRNSRRNSIVGNTIINSSQESNGTYSDIFLRWADEARFAAQNVVASNGIYALSANKSKYGVEEENSGCDYNLVQGNVIAGQASGAVNLLGANSLSVNNI